MYLVGGQRSCLLFTIVAKRLRMHHVTQSFAPTALIVIISWMSLWLHVDAVPGRIMLGITTLLTVVTLKNAATHGLPQV